MPPVSLFCTEALSSRHADCLEQSCSALLLRSLAQCTSEPVTCPCSKDVPLQTGAKGRGNSLQMPAWAAVSRLQAACADRIQTAAETCVSFAAETAVTRSLLCSENPRGPSAASCDLTSCQLAKSVLAVVAWAACECCCKAIQVHHGALEWLCNGFHKLPLQSQPELVLLLWKFCSTSGDSEHSIDSHQGMCLLLLQAVKGEAAELVRMFLQTPMGFCHVDITRAVVQSHLHVTSPPPPSISGLNSGFSILSQS